jgi:uncharacterized paraquat-inducible protein A
MAITACRECTEPVSNAAAACPHCGIKRPDGQQSSRAVVAQLLLVLLLAVPLAMLLLTVVLG